MRPRERWLMDMTMARLNSQIQETDEIIADVRHVLAYHTHFGNRKNAIEYCAGRFYGKPHVPCSCVGGP